MASHNILGEQNRHFISYQHVMNDKPSFSVEVIISSPNDARGERILIIRSGTVALVRSTQPGRPGFERI
jgi:hypothetical protein